MGPLSTARYIEAFSLLVAQLAYDGADGPALAYRFERFPNQARKLVRCPQAQKKSKALTIADFNYWPTLASATSLRPGLSARSHTARSSRKYL